MVLPAGATGHRAVPPLERPTSYGKSPGPRRTREPGCWVTTSLGARHRVSDTGPAAMLHVDEHTGPCGRYGVSPGDVRRTLHTATVPQETHPSRMPRGGRRSPPHSRTASTAQELRPRATKAARSPVRSRRSRCAEGNAPLQPNDGSPEAYQPSPACARIPAPDGDLSIARLPRHGAESLPSRPGLIEGVADG